MKRTWLVILAVALAACDGGSPGGGARQRAEAPPLQGTRDTTQAVSAFVDWAAGSTAVDAPEIHAHIDAARMDQAVVDALADHAVLGWERDHTGALVALSLLGEMRSPLAEGHFERILDMTLPDEAADAEGEEPRHTALAMLQAKAIDGLAYLRSDAGDAEVLRAVAEHPSRVVRAEAIDAYLWNHGDSATARATLLGYIHTDERIFLDRVRVLPDQDAAAFDAKLAAFLAEHPEIVPPEPQRRTP